MANQRILPVFALLLSSLGVSAQKITPAKVPFVRVRWSATTLHITYQTAKIDHDFSESLPDQSKPEFERFWLHEIHNVRTQRLLEKGGRVYMLLDIEGPSRGPEGASHYCGAGTEKALALFQLDSEGLLDEPQVVNYESCLLTIEPPDASENSGPTPLSSKQPFVKVFTLTRMRGPADPRDFAVNRDLVTVETRFDPLRPERGLVTKEKVEHYKSAAAKPN
jgi:hypothetical protein